MSLIFSPFHPLARNASVGPPGSSSSATMSSRRSLRPLSLSPHVTIVRLTITASAPARARRSGEHRPLEHVAQLVGDARDGIDDLAVDRADQPGGRTAGLRDDRRTVGNERLTQVVGGHPPTPGGEHLDDALGDLVVGNAARRPSRRRSPLG